MRSAAVSLSMARSGSNEGAGSEAISQPQESERMLGLLPALETACDLAAGHGAVARIVLGSGGLDALDDRAADLHRCGAEFLLHAVGAVVSGAALDRLHGGVGDEAQHIPGLQADVLHAQVTGDVIAHLAERALEVGTQEAPP